MPNQSNSTPAKPLTSLEFAQLQLANSISEWNGILKSMLRTRGGEYPSDYSEKMFTKREGDIFSIADAKMYQFQGISYPNKYYTIDSVSEDIIACEKEELKKILADVKVESSREFSRGVSHSPSSATENSELGIADKTILAYWLKNDPTKIPEYLRKYIPTEKNDEGSENDELNRRAR